MSKRLILVLAFVLLAGLTCAAYAEVQNVKVSGDITETGIIRDHLNLRDNVVGGTTGTSSLQGTGFGENVNAILSQIRVRVDADLTDNVSTSVRLINERVWGRAGQNDNINEGQDSSIDLDLAYATLKEFLYSPLTLTVGRQELRYGNALVIGNVSTNQFGIGHGTTNRVLPDSIDDLSLRKSFDAVKATLNYDPLVIDVVGAKIFKGDVAQNNDTNLYGVNASYALRKDINLEGYWWQRNRKSDENGTITAAGVANLVDMDKRERLNVVGARAVITRIAGLTLQGEAAYEFGDHLLDSTLYPNEASAALGLDARRKVQAWAIQGMASYALPVAKKYVPMVSGSYTYLSGDKYLNSGRTVHGWDPMFEDQNGGTIFNKIFKATNYQLINGGVSMKPMDDLKLSLDAYYLLLNRKYTDPATGIYLSGNVNDPTYKMTSKRALGLEWQAGLTYDYTEDVQFGLTGGIFMPGAAFSSDNRDAAKQVMGSMKVTF